MYLFDCFIAGLLDCFIAKKRNFATQNLNNNQAI